MAAIIEVEYFNSFWLKKISDNGGSYPLAQAVPNAIYPGTDPTGYNLYNNSPAFPGPAGNTTYSDTWEPDWFIEESRIRGGYNNTSVDFGVKAYIEEENVQTDGRSSALIYSGIFNSRTGINQTNEFPTAFEITRSLDPAYGSVQKLYAEDTNLICFQERKVSRALIDKDAIYSAEGNATLTTTDRVIGEFVPYVGEYGISKNPESFAKFGFRKYFVDKDQGTVMRLSRDGMTEISAYGLTDYFRDRLQEIPNNRTVVKANATNQDITGVPSTSNTVTVTLTDGRLELGMIVELNGIEQPTTIYITDISFGGGTTYTVTLSEQLTFPNLVTGDSLVFINSLPTRIVGGWDIYNRNYVLSLQDTSSYFPLPSPQYSNGKTNTYSTLCFDDQINGWVSFYTYKPDWMFSVKDRFWTTSQYNSPDDNAAMGYLHYVDLKIGANQGNYGIFYNEANESAIEFIFNDVPSVVKNFQTISYEGDNGWEVDYFYSSAQEFDKYTTNTGTFIHLSYRDDTVAIKSYDEGVYYVNGFKERSGFLRKENRYVANLLNNSETRPEEVVTGRDDVVFVNPNGSIDSLQGGNKISGIKGYFSIVRMSTDNTTDIRGRKELFSVGTKYVISS